MLPSEGDAIHILEALESEVAHIPGGRDREGQPLIVVNVPPGELPSSIKSNLESVIEYYLSIFHDDTRQDGLCLLVDIRGTLWRIARSYIRLLMLVVGSQARSIIVIRPDGFWDKRIDNCTKVRKEGEPIYITSDKLSLYVEISQLPYELDGNKAYDHSQWIQTRLRIEAFVNESLELITRMTCLHRRLTTLDGIYSRDSKENMSISFLETSHRLSTDVGRVLNSGIDMQMKLILDTIRLPQRWLKKFKGSP